MTKSYLFDIILNRIDKRVWRSKQVLLNRYELKVYQAGLKFVFYVAVKKVLKCDINFAHSLDKGLYVKFITKRIITVFFI